jgi:dipeptidyl aminopeptidase/acylaminoacyl peptidase
MKSVFPPRAAGPGSAAAPPAPPVPADPEVVIRQARARQRRWRRRTVAVVAAVLVAGGAMYLATRGPSGPEPGRRQPAWESGPVPSVDTAAFTGHGELAFVSRGTLWVLDGATRALRRVATPGMRPADPVFSADGRWLAFTGVSATPAAQARTVWLAVGDGSGAHQVVASGGLIGWSPAADLLAVTTGNMVRLIMPTGPARALVPPRALSRWPGHPAAAPWPWPPGTPGRARWLVTRLREGGPRRACCCAPAAA